MQPLREHRARLFLAHVGGRGRQLRVRVPRERQEQLLGHRVVAELVDVAHDLRELRRLERERERGVGRQCAVMHLARQLAAHLAPQRGHQAPLVAGRLGVGQRPVARPAGGRIRAAEAPARRVAGCQLQPAAPVAAAALAQRHRGVHAQAGERRLRTHARHLARGIGLEAERDGAVVHQQRVGQHVVGLGRRVVEVGRRARVGRETAVVEHDVAADVAHARVAQLAQQQPHTLHHQARVAGAHDHHGAPQHAVAHRPGEVDAGLPRPRRAQGVERGAGGDQLEHRCGIHAEIGVPAPGRPRRVHGLHPQRERARRHVRLVERGGDGRRQRPRGRGGRPRGAGGQREGGEGEGGEPDHGGVEGRKRSVPGPGGPGRGHDRTATLFAMRPLHRLRPRDVPPTPPARPREGMRA